MLSKEKLVEKFQITGCENLSDEILDKCVELCYWYETDEEDFMDMWLAFAIGHLNGNLEPTLKALEEMKRTTPKSAHKDHETLNEQQEKAKNYINTPKADIWTNDEEEILGLYATPETLSRMQTKRPRSPDLEDKSAGGSGCKAQLGERSPVSDHVVPATQTTTATQSSFSSQSSAGKKVVLSIGPKVTTWVTDKKIKFTIRRAGPHVPANSRYMFELLKTTSDVRTRVCRTIGFHINTIWSEQKKDDMLVTWNVRTRHQKKYRTWGRVCFDSETKQSNPTVLLEGCRKSHKSNNADNKLWPHAELDVSELRECCLFPGQIIAVEGLNLNESLIRTTDIFASSFIPAAKPPHLTDNLNIVIAAGPFTQSNDLNYQPLWELMSKVAEDEPHMLILIGPFLEYTHPHVQNDLLTCNYLEFFNELIAKIKSYIAGKCTQIVLVSSSRDVHHHAVYPTPEYLLPKTLVGPEIHVVPDPCTLDIEGLRLGITSIDCLMHLGREEVVLKPSGIDKLSRLGNYILNQACFYPLYPSPKEINIDCELWEKYAFLKEKPHMLLLPSDMRYFCKYINESTILNPERLSKRSFARINIKPATDGSWCHENISCEIIKM